MSNIDKFLNAAKDLGSSVTKSAMKYVPTALSPDKQLACGYGTALALMICADYTVDTDETIAGMQFIREQEVLRSKDIVVTTIDFYSEFVRELMLHGNSAEFYVEVAKTIEQNIMPLDKDSKLVISGMVDSICGRNANAFELGMRTELMKALK